MAKEKESNNNGPNDISINSAIVEADGYAFLAEDKTLREIREEALVNAKREALEKGQTYIKSFTEVENFQLNYDLVQSQSEGFIKILESKDHGILPDNRYRYWIKAEIEYRICMPEDPEKQNIITNCSAPLTVMVWTEKPVYQSGEKIKIFLRGNKNFYGRVLYLNTKKEILQLLPNQLRRENFFAGGKVFSLPEPADGFQLEVIPPFGTETIVVYAGSAPLGLLETVSLDNSMYRVPTDLASAGNVTRGVGNTGAGIEFFEARCEVTTKP